MKKAPLKIITVKSDKQLYPYNTFFSFKQTDVIMNMMNNLKPAKYNQLITKKTIVNFSDH